MGNKLFLDNEYTEKIIGVDEAGRGPLAGPVVAAAIYFKKDIDINGLDDSKKISDKKRREIFERLTNNEDIIFSFSVIDEKIIDEINILNATFLAMRNALNNLKLNLDEYLVLVDGNKEIREYYKKQQAIVKGDSKSKSIAAASIIAKVIRDDIMIKYDKIYPKYQFSKHKGYGTKKHYEMIRENGILDIHRRTFLKNL